MEKFLTPKKDLTGKIKKATDICFKFGRFRLITCPLIYYNHTGESLSPNVSIFVVFVFNCMALYVVLQNIK